MSIRIPPFSTEGMFIPGTDSTRDSLAAKVEATRQESTSSTDRFEPGERVFVRETGPVPNLPATVLSDTVTQSYGTFVKVQLDDGRTLVKTAGHVKRMGARAMARASKGKKP